MLWEQQITNTTGEEGGRYAAFVLYIGVGLFVVVCYNKVFAVWVTDRVGEFNLGINLISLQVIIESPNGINGILTKERTFRGVREVQGLQCQSGVGDGW